jgi:hypothetical protein
MGLLHGTKFNGRFMIWRSGAGGFSWWFLGCFLGRFVISVEGKAVSGIVRLRRA